MAWSMLEEIENHRKAMTAKELSAILDVAPQTVYKWARQKQIPSIPMGDTVRFDPRSIGYWLRKKDPMLAKAMKSEAA